MAGLPGSDNLWAPTRAVDVAPPADAGLTALTVTTLSGASPLLVAPVWGVVGVGLGVLVRIANVRLARIEGLTAGGSRWQRYGPALVAALVLALLGWRNGAHWPLLLRSLWALILVQVIFFDAEHHLVLDRVILPAGLAAIGLSFVTPGLGWQSALIAGGGAGLVFLLIAIAGALYFRTEAMGLGDVKLAAFIGLVLGIVYTTTALLAGVILAGVVAVVLLALRLKSRRDAIPYGPFLSLGGLLGLFLSSGGYR